MRSRPAHVKAASPARYAARLVIMVKEPVAGRVKTRLARGIGTVAATAAYRAMVYPLVARLSCDRRWQTLLAVGPDFACATRMLPCGTLRRPQGYGDLGRRLQFVFDQLPRGPAVVIGTDIPAIRADDIAAAFRALGSNDAVFGPSSDGGYWLVGMKRSPRVRRAFHGVRWSSEHALADTKANLKGSRIAHLRALDDVDTVQDLAQQRAMIGRRVMQPAFS